MLKILLIPIGVLLSYSSLWAMSHEDARHLLSRSGFDEPPDTVVTLARLSRQAGVDLIVRSADTAWQVEPPGWTSQDKRIFKPSTGMSRVQRREAKRKHIDHHREWLYELQDWLLEQAVKSSSPLAERMTYFWQNHFTSSWLKVRQTQLMFDQLTLLRTNALGSYAEMLKGIVRDPAMLVYLDNQQNKKHKPNENLARELLELFSLGEGNYSEKDIKEAARALSGWSVDKDAAFVIKKKQHDDGEKTFLGETGHFDGDDIVDTILRQDSTAEFIVTKLWREFISPASDKDEVSRLAKLFRDSGYQIKPLLTALFTTDQFWAEENRGSLIKSPLQFVVGTIRSLEIPVENYRPLAKASRAMGQRLFNPPNVKGWPGGIDWIHSSTLISRKNFLARALRGQDMKNAAMLMQAANNRQNSPLENFAEGIPIKAIEKMLLCCAPAAVEHRGSREQQIRDLLFDPVYQLN